MSRLFLNSNEPEKRGNKNLNNKKKNNFDSTSLTSLAISYWYNTIIYYSIQDQI